jgi:hypothetical protein
MLVGHARTSSLGQVAGLEGQEREFQGAGCEKVFWEQLSLVAKRDQLEQDSGAVLISCVDGRTGFVRPNSPRPSRRHVRRS